MNDTPLARKRKKVYFFDMAKRVRTRPRAVYMSVFTKPGSVLAGGTVIASVAAPGSCVFIAPADIVEISDSAATTRFVTEKEEGEYNCAPGTMFSFGGEIIPPGFLRCNGESVLKAVFADLYEAIGEKWGAPADAEHFYIPDTRGLFERDLDDGRGIDPDHVRDVGQLQTSGAPNITGGFWDLTESQKTATSMGAANGAFYKNYIPESNAIHAAAETVTVASVGDGIGFDASKSSSCYVNGLQEVRPYNFATKKIIKY